MNKQEFQQKLKDMKPPKFFNAITLSEAYKAGFEEAKGNALCDSCFLNEPEKPVIPKYVADWIEWCKKNKVTLLGAMSPIDELGTAICNDKKVESLDASKWATRNQETFAKAWLYGYEVEKEKLYTVELPNPNAGGHVVLCKTSDGIVSIFFAGMARWKGGKNFQLTEAEIKKDFEWAWKWAKPVEEVEE